MSRFWIYTVLILTVSFPVLGNADDMDFIPDETKKSKDLKFDTGLVEGVGDADGNYGSVATDWKRQNRGHLYSKEMSFEREMKETLRNVRYSR